MIGYLKKRKWYKIIKSSSFFDAKYYLFTYPDVRTEDIDPIWHYINYGASEGRNPSKNFDTNFYLNTYKDVKDSKINPLVHYILYGKYEGRKTMIIKKVIKEFKTNGVNGVANKVKQKILTKANKYTYKVPILTEDIKEEIKSFSYKPLVSIIMPVYNVEPKWLDLAIKSIKNQWYENWELCIVDDKSNNEKTINYLKNIKDAKIKIKYLDKNLNISGASNEALKMVNGEYIALMDNDDEITPDALYEVVKAINEKQAEFIYSDEDKLEMDGTFSEPHYKPDFAPDMFLSQNYISHLGVIKKELIDKVNGFTIGLEGSQDYDLYLKVLEHTDKIYHIQKVLYHWRKIPSSTASEFSGKSYAQEAGRKALENAMKRRKIEAIVENGKYPGTYRVKYKIKGNSLVSIIIPFKDKPELLKMCIESILDKSTYENFEIVGISNNSEEKETFDEMKRLENFDKRVKFYEYNVPFNYSKINNYAVKKYAKGEHIILLNNDIEIITSEWIEELLMHSQRDEVGVVGAKLYYPNDTIQHAGVVIGIGGVAGHAHKYFSKNETGYFARLHLIQNFCAVTAACLMVKKSLISVVLSLGLLSSSAIAKDRFFNNSFFDSDNDDTSSFFQNPIDETEDLFDFSDKDKNDGLSQDQIDDLEDLYEFEKLRKDVYSTFDDIWDSDELKDLEKSAEDSMDDIEKVFDDYDLDLPVLSDEAGVFEDEDLEDTYDSIIKDGENSLEDALDESLDLDNSDSKSLEDILDFDKINIFD